MLSIRSNKKWNKKEIKKLGFLYSNDVPVDKIRKLLNRTDQSIMGTARRFKFSKHRGLRPQKNDIEIKKYYQNLSKKLKKNSNDFGVYTRRISHFNEQSTIIKLIKLNFDVYKPILDSSVADLIIFKNKKMFKIQVKTAGYSERFDYFESKLASRKHTSNKSLTLRYSKKEIDFFIIKLSGIFKFYVIPIKDALSQKSANLRMFPNRKKVQIKSRANVFNTDKYFEAFDLIK